jgi:hypothetical protein
MAVIYIRDVERDKLFHTRFLTAYAVIFLLVKGDYRAAGSLVGSNLLPVGRAFSFSLRRKQKSGVPRYLAGESPPSFFLFISFRRWA